MHGLGNTGNIHLTLPTDSHWRISRPDEKGFFLPGILNSHVVPVSAAQHGPLFIKDPSTEPCFLGRQPFVDIPDDVEGE